MQKCRNVEKYVIIQTSVCRWLVSGGRCWPRCSAECNAVRKDGIWFVVSASLVGVRPVVGVGCAFSGHISSTDSCPLFQLLLCIRREKPCARRSAVLRRDVCFQKEKPDPGTVGKYPAWVD